MGHVSGEKFQSPLPSEFDRRFGVVRFQDEIQKFFAHLPDVWGVVPAHQTQTFHVDVIHVHLPILPFGPQFRGVPLLTVENVWVVRFLEFQVVRFFEKFRALLRRALSEIPTVLDGVHTGAPLAVKLDHHGVRISVPHDRAWKVLLDVRLRLFDHAPTLRGRRRRDLRTRKHPRFHPGETVHAVHAYLVRQLLAVVDLFHESGGTRHVLLRFFTESLEFVQDRRKEGWHVLGKLVRLPTHLELLVGDTGDVPVLWIFDECGVTQIVCHHDARIQGGEIQRGDGRVVRALLGVQHGRAHVPFRNFYLFLPKVHLLRFVVLVNRGHHEPQLLRLLRQLGENFYLLSPGDEEIQWHPRGVRHLQQVEKGAQTLEQPVGKEGVLDAVPRHLHELVWVTFPVTRKHLLRGHVDLFIPQVQLTHTVQGITVQLVSFFHFLEEIEDKSSGHG